MDENKCEECGCDPCECKCEECGKEPCECEESFEEVVENNDLVLNSLVELLIQKGVISEKELDDKMDEIEEDMYEDDDEESSSEEAPLEKPQEPAE